jgi:4-diphosphocytidyl-2-C-methyl-D-erythritol kinase
MIYFPNAKINLGLHVVEKRPDGFHNIETIFYPIKLSDVLEIIPYHSFEFHLSGITIDCNNNENLIVKAYNLLKSNYDIPPIYMQLHKIIPMGAGLGGGSSDAAFVLQALNSEFKLNINNSLLTKYAAHLGSDCAFFISNCPSIATGRGDILNKINVNLQNYHLILVKPNININTADAYSYISPQKRQQSLIDIISSPIHTWKDNLTNDFEPVIFKRYPQIAAIKQKLYDIGALYAAMSGSGSTIYGLFKEKVNINRHFENCFTYYEYISEDK